LPLKELFALISVSQALICPDSGPAHMATAAGTPVIGLYASSNPDRTGPYLSRDSTVNMYPEAVGRFLGKTVDDLRWGQRVRDPGADSPGQRQSAYRSGFCARFLTFFNFSRFYR
jgi:heptosyltransferase I